MITSNRSVAALVLAAAFATASVACSEETAGTDAPAENGGGASTFSPSTTACVQ